jgi:hypothetical protein
MSKETALVAISTACQLFEEEYTERGSSSEGRISSHVDRLELAIKMYRESAPPPLGISVRDGTKVSDRTGR